MHDDGFWGAGKAKIILSNKLKLFDFDGFGMRAERIKFGSH